MKVMLIKNKLVVPTINFLNEMKLKSSQSRMRSKVIRKLMAICEDMQIQEKELGEEFAQRNDNGDLVQAEDSNGYLIEPTKKSEYISEYAKFINEDVELQLEDTTLLPLKEILENYEGELCKDDAEVYDVLLDFLDEVCNGLEEK